MTDKLQAVRAKIIEAVPEIVELKYGALCIYKGQRMTFIRNDTTGRPWLLVGWAPYVVGDECVENFVLGGLQVIGRPITLADVLRAVGVSDKVHEFHTDVYGPYMTMQYDFPGTRGYVYWDLSVPLDEQSPEVIDFLHKILCV